MAWLVIAGLAVYYAILYVVIPLGLLYIPVCIWRWHKQRKLEARLEAEFQAWRADLYKK